jgi:predicted pyridoxine 5'-phosphate oxidase superfamily flavin-nucleotide-binding protein
MAAATFHAGELALQQRAGSFQRLAEVGPRVIRDHMPEPHREFFALLPFLLAGTVDAQGQPWASVLAGPPGFVHSPDPRSLRIAAAPLPHDPLAGTLVEGMPIGLLGIQPHTRRRNRVNGRVVALDAGGFTIQVSQSFGNCPKYIEPREPHHAAAAGAVSMERLAALDAAAARLAASADTFFIATAHPRAGADGEPAHGVDVSHRGGPAGFVQVDGNRLAVPDFVGNGFFNTLGNLQLEPRCGLLFVDFFSGELLYLAARAEVQWVEAQRQLVMEVSQAIRVRGSLPLRWDRLSLRA